MSVCWCLLNSYPTAESHHHERHLHGSCVMESSFRWLSTSYLLQHFMSPLQSEELEVSIKLKVKCSLKFCWWTLRNWNHDDSCCGWSVGEENLHTDFQEQRPSNLHDCDQRTHGPVWGRNHIFEKIQIFLFFFHELYFNNNFYIRKKEW